MSDDLSQRPIPDIVASHPETVAVFEKFGINPTYEALKYETITASAKVNNVDEAALLAALQQAIG